jgi:hypothetical protein
MLRIWETLHTIASEGYVDVELLIVVDVIEDVVVLLVGARGVLS